jgi:hypothetical protein
VAVERVLERHRGVDDISAEVESGFRTGVEAFFKKLKVAVNKDGFSEFHSQIAEGIGDKFICVGTLSYQSPGPSTTSNIPTEP